MFAGLCIMCACTMSVGIPGGETMVSVETESNDAALALPHARGLDVTGQRHRSDDAVEPTKFDPLSWWTAIQNGFFEARFHTG